MKLQTIFAAVVLTAGLTGTASAAVQTRVVDYTQDGTPLQGLLAWNDSATGKRPGVLVVHEWWGHNEHARTQARKLAEAGYVAFALDMYGKGKVTTHPDDAMKFMSEATQGPGRGEGAVRCRAGGAQGRPARRHVADRRHRLLLRRWRRAEHGARRASRSRRSSRSTARSARSATSRPDRSRARCSCRPARTIRWCPRQRWTPSRPR